MTQIGNIVDSLFRLAYIERWNDHPKPFSITELDKQAHKACIAFLLAKMEEKEKRREVDWIGLINGLLFEALQRSVLTDIKPRLFHRVLKERGNDVNNYVFTAFEDTLTEIDPDLFKEMKSYFANDQYLYREKRIIKAAHFLATYWEFQFVYQIASSMYGIEETKKELDNTVEEFIDLIGVQKFLLHKKTHGFIDICGQLRFQKRWIQTPRIPQTSVLGHAFMVAVIAYLMVRRKSRGKQPVNKMWWYGSFFAGLFHDLPEVTTRDIISSVKSVLGEEIIRDMELKEMERRILPLLPTDVVPEMRFLLGILNGSNGENTKVHEFSSRIFDGVLSKSVGNIEAFCYKVNKNGIVPIDGYLLKKCDKFVAFAEAIYSRRHGITSGDLEEATDNLYKELNQEEELKDIVNHLYTSLK